MQDRPAFKRVISEEGEASLVKSVYSRESEGNDTCPITQEKFSDGDEITTLPCGHTFHSPAVLSWLRESSASCPVCRRELESKEVREEGEVHDDGEESEEEEDNETAIPLLMGIEAARRRRIHALRHRLTRYMRAGPTGSPVVRTWPSFVPPTSIRERMMRQIDDNVQSAYEEEDSVDLQAAIMASMAAESNGEESPAPEENEEEEVIIESPLFGTLFSSL
jgi:hypothetical protein